MGKTRQFRPTKEDLVDTSRQNIKYHETHGYYIDMLGGKCAECESIEYLELHHITGADVSPTRPGAERMRDWKIQYANDNLMVLCVECHKDITHNRPTLNMSKREGAIKHG